MRVATNDLPRSAAHPFYARLNQILDQYTVEIRQGYLPPFRGRKWTGAAVYEWRGGDLSPEYRMVLQEVRKLWQAQGRQSSAVVSRETTPAFYQTLVPATSPRR